MLEFSAAKRFAFLLSSSLGTIGQRKLHRLRQPSHGRHDGSTWACSLGQDAAVCRNAVQKDGNGSKWMVIQVRLHPQSSTHNWPSYSAYKFPSKHPSKVELSGLLSKTSLKGKFTGTFYTVNT